MSYAIDLNVLLLASNGAAPEHAVARSFLEQSASRPEILCLAWPTVMGYLRIATHPSIFDQPLSPSQAIANLRSLLSLPQARALGEREGFFEIYEKIASSAIRGNLVPDAHLAVILLQNRVTTLYTKDTGFRRFEFLDVREPF